MSKPKIDEKGYHFTICGLDNVWLRNGYLLEEEDGESSVTFFGLDNLHKAIGFAIVKNPPSLRGKQIRFIRHQMEMTQNTLAGILGCDVQSVARYEKEQSYIPVSTDKLIRMLFVEKNENEKISLSTIMHMNIISGLTENKPYVFVKTSSGWEEYNEIFHK